MIMKRHILALLALLTISIPCMAQDNMTQGTVDLPQAMSLNPAMRPRSSFLSIPFFGSFQVGVSNSFSYNNIIEKRDGVKYLNTKSLLSATSSAGSGFIASANLDLINLGFYVSPDDFIGISVRARVHGAMNWPSDLFGFMLDNPLEADRNFAIDYSPNVLGWVEAGVSYSRPVSDNFTVGVRFKYVGGLVSLQSRNGIQFNVNKQYDRYTLSGDYDIMAGNINLAGDGQTDDLLRGMSRNPGFAVDLGVSFLSNDKHFSASASVSDLGAIWWNAENSSRIKVSNPNEKFDFTGVGDLNFAGGSPIDFGNAIDSTFKAFNRTMGVDTISGVGFSTMLPTTFQAMGSYAIDRHFRHNVSVGFIGSLPYRGGFDYAVSAGYAYRTLNGMWQLMANYTYTNYNPIGIGLGVAFTAGCFQMYLATDNIIPVFSIPNARGTGARLAFNFFLDHHRYRR